MRRKTNLFYKSASQDSNFLTFSNYTESLTANLMSTDNKIYPSTFLCIQMNKLSDYNYAKETYEKFIGNIYDSNNVKYVLKVNVYDYYVNENKDTQQILEYPSNKKWYAGTFLSKEEVEYILNQEKTKVLVEFYKNDSNHTKLNKNISNNVSNSVTTITIEKTYLDYEDDPKFIKDSSDQLSIYLWNKQQLINELISHYENKMATLRDWCIDNDFNQEEKLMPLNYLIETLKDFDSSCSINYVGDVTEQDWNGTFADTICVVDTNKFKSGTIKEEIKDLNLANVTYMNSDNYLHGWYVNKHPYIKELDFDNDGKNTVSIRKNGNSLYDDLISAKTEEWVNKFKRNHEISTSDTDDYNSYIMQFPLGGKTPPKEYLDTLDSIIKASEIKEEWVGPHYVEDLKPIYDNEENGNIYYNISSNINSIEYESHDNVNEWKSLEFNLLIPLFDIVDMNYQTNSTSIESTSYMMLHDTDDEKKLMCVKNVPLGIWFSGPQNVTLKADLATGFSPTWSLSLSSQFKPFPKSTYMPDEITQDAKKEAFLTFAQILSRQNQILDKFSDMSKMINGLSDRVSSLESSIGAVLTSYNIDNFRTDIMDFKNSITYQVSYLESTIEGLELRWVNREG